MRKNYILLLMLISLAQTITAQSKAYFSEKFANNNFGWELKSDENLESKIENGVLELSSKTDMSYVISKEIIFPKNENYRIDTQFKSISSPNAKGMNLLKFAMGDEGSYEYGFNANGELILAKREKGQNAKLLVNKGKIEDYKPGTPVTLSIVYIDETYHFFVNKKPWKKASGLTSYGDEIGFKVASKNTLDVNYLSIKSFSPPKPEPKPEPTVVLEETPFLVAVGVEAKEIKGNSPNKKSQSLSSMEGNYVFVYFWASWNTKSRTELKMLTKTLLKYEEKFSFKTLVFGVEKDQTAWEKAIRQDKTKSLNHISDLKLMDSKVAQDYKLEDNLPRNMIISPSGKILAIDLSVRDLQKKLDELF